MTSVTSQHKNSRDQLLPRRSARKTHVILVALVLFGALITVATRTRAQSTSPHITAVDPASGKVSGTVTLTGTNLGKATVTAVYLSDDKSDYKATLVEQSAEKLVFKVPQVKAGEYNLSVQIGTQILIMPSRFTVE
jgi:hypothetical protein